MNWIGIVLITLCIHDAHVVLSASNVNISGFGNDKQSVGTSSVTSGQDQSISSSSTASNIANSHVKSKVGSTGAIPGIGPNIYDQDTDTFPGDGSSGFSSLNPIPDATSQSNHGARAKSKSSPTDSTRDSGSASKNENHSKGSASSGYSELHKAGVTNSDSTSGASDEIESQSSVSDATSKSHSSKPGKLEHAGPKHKTTKHPKSTSSSSPDSTPKYSGDSPEMVDFFDSIAAMNANSTTSVPSTVSSSESSSESPESKTTVASDLKSTKEREIESKNSTPSSLLPSSSSSSSAFSSTSTEKPSTESPEKDKNSSLSDIFAGSYWTKSKDKVKSGNKSSASASSSSSSKDDVADISGMVDYSSLKSITPEIKDKINSIISKSYNKSKDLVAGLIQTLTQSAIDIYASLINNDKKD